MQYEAAVIVPHGNTAAQLAAMRQFFISELKTHSSANEKQIFYPFFPLCFLCPAFNTDSLKKLRDIFQERKLSVAVHPPVLSGANILSPVVIRGENVTSVHPLFLAFSETIPDIRSDFDPSSALGSADDAVHIRVFQIQKLRVSAGSIIPGMRFAQKTEILDSCWVKIQ